MIFLIMAVVAWLIAGVAQFVMHDSQAMTFWMGTTIFYAVLALNKDLTKESE